MRQGLLIKVYLFLALLVLSSLTYSIEPNDPLPSWNNGATKQSIIQFVQSVTDNTSKDYVPPENRIATFDNDGTLWIEQPLYTQETFLMIRFKELLRDHPEWKQQASFKSVLNHAPNHLSPQNMETIFTVTSSQISVEDYHRIVKKWLKTAENSRFKHHYTELVYQPMLEVMNYLRANQFTVYIVSGAGQDFIRAFSQETYHISPEQVIGATTKTHYTYQNGKPILIKIPQLLFTTNKAGKPEAINLFIGKKPIIAFGNSDGDQQMLEWTQSGPGERLMLLVHHDDAKREYAYDTQSKIGTFSAPLFEEAKKNHWHVISMKNDWKVIFPFEVTP